MREADDGAGEAVAAEPGGDAPGRRRGFTFPGALTVLVIVTVVVWLLAFLIPAGQYRRNADGAPMPGTYRQVGASQSFLDRLNELFLAPVNGLYGVQDTGSHRVGPDQSGLLYGSAGVFLFVLAIGAFITVVFATGALDRGIARLAHTLRHRGVLLIAGVMLAFSVLGTVEGFSEETLGSTGCSCR